MYVRYLDGIRKNKLDFVARPYFKHFELIFFLFFCVLLLCFVAALAKQINSTSYWYIYFWYSIYFCAGFLFFTVFLLLRRLRSFIAAVEFQNMLYSNAAKALTSFYMIIKTNGEIIYKDDRIPKGSLLDILGEDHHYILNEIKNKKYYHQFEKGNEQIVIRPMIRPGGYLVLSAIDISQEKIYGKLLKKNCIYKYKVENNDITADYNTGYIKHFKEIFLTEKHKCKTFSLLLKDNGDSTFFKNDFLEENGIYYGVLIPKIPKLKQVFNNALFGVAVLDKNLNLIEYNKAFFELTSTSTNLNNALKEKIDDFSKSSSVLNLNLQNGNYLRTYITDLKGVFMGFFVDISELKGLEEKFQHSQKIASVGELSGGIAHDFNNILTAIMGFCDILLEDMQIDDNHYYDVTQIKYSSQRGQSLVKKILAFARNQKLEIEILDINVAISSLRQMLERLIPEDLNLEFDLGPNLKSVNVDRGQLEQSLINLVVNARDATPPGGKILIKTESVLIGKKNVVLEDTSNSEIMFKGEYVKVTVQDNGSGIKKEIISKIFDPFFSTKEVGKGTGLGLSSVYGTVKQMKSYIDVKSQPGVGSEFYIFIPACYEAPSAEMANTKPKTLFIEERQIKEKKILLVEDEKIVRKFLQKGLKQKGFDVVECENATSALEVFMNNNFDIVITDVIMPGISGPEMAKEMRKTHQNQKVIFISGYTRNKLNLSKDDKNSYFIEKPFNLRDLLSIIAEILN